ncbi:MAG: DNA polymerase III subunit gamma/tau [Clostridiales Family XIII bacterium]|jgi:DNA polymerase-3 subunit gamma/tau|nr:DNA polymerase III subunit gamma/tau [Clostridiales Family XIII bacterium]
MSDRPYEAIYRRFRPATFDKVLGQRHVVNVLRAQIAAGNVPHAYLFSGTRGTGKTTMARLLAKGLNCLAEAADGRPCGVCENCRSIQDGTFVDVIELDAASNNGVDNIREITQVTVYPPTVGRKRVFIIDEVHMLSNAAVNAFLKTLEEPPENTVFVLATTEPGKLPATIRSRCLSFEFKRVPASVIAEGLGGIVSELGLSAAPDALALIAANADGSVRDALSILEACVAAGGALDRSAVLEAVGSPGDEQIALLAAAVFGGRTAEALAAFGGMMQDGKEARRVIEDWVDYLRSALLVRYLDKPEAILNRSLENIAAVREQTAGIGEKRITAQVRALSKLYNESRWSAQPGILVEMLIIELSEDANLSIEKE